MNKINENLFKIIINHRISYINWREVITTKLVRQCSNNKGYGVIETTIKKYTHKINYIYVNFYSSSIE